MSKRNQFAAFAHPSSSIAKRLKKVETLARSNKPETKSVTFVAAGTIAAGGIINVDCTNIAEGSSSNERIGDKIHVQRIEIRGLIDPDLDAHVIKCNATTKPTTALFTSGIGTFLLQSELGSRFREILHYRNGQSIEDFNSTFAVNRKLGYNCHYSGTLGTTAQIGCTTVTVLNRTTAVKNHAFTVRLYYTDA